MPFVPPFPPTTRTRVDAMPAALALCALLATTLTPSAARAQSLWLPRDSGASVMLEMQRPNVESLDNDDYSAAYFLGGRFSLGEHVAIVGEVPYMRLESSNGAGEFYFVDWISGSSVGNPYLGIETKAATSPIFLELGVRVPLASDAEDDLFPLYIGQFVDATRWNAFVPDMTSIQAAFDVREVTPKRMAYRLRLSPVVTLPSDGGDDDLHVHYSFDIGYHGSWARIGGGMSGHALLTGDYGNLGTRTSNQMDLHGDFLEGHIRPGLSLALPLGSTANAIPVVVGLHLSWVK